MTPKEKVQRAEKALGELKLGATTEADRTRCDRIWQGLRSLDEEQAAAKEERDTLSAQLEAKTKRVEKLEGALKLLHPRNATERYERMAEEFSRTTGHIAPGKDMPVAMAYLPDDDDRRHALWEKFCADWRERFVDAALSEEGGG